MKIERSEGSRGRCRKKNSIMINMSMANQWLERSVNSFLVVNILSSCKNSGSCGESGKKLRSRKISTYNMDSISEV